jgi:PhnB protein
LTFPGTCADAFRFYERVLDGKRLALFTYRESPTAADVPPEWRDKIVHAGITIGGEQLAGADVPTADYVRPRGFFLLVSVDDRAAAERVFTALADGGVVQMPLERTFWSPAFGVVVDRFGVPWEVSAAQEVSGARG